MNASVCEFFFNAAKSKERQIRWNVKFFQHKFFLYMLKTFFHNICRLSYFRVKHILWKFNRNTCKYVQRIRIPCMHESIQGFLKLCCFTVHFDVDVFHSVICLQLSLIAFRSSACPFCYRSVIHFGRENRQWIHLMNDDVNEVYGE